MYPHGKDKNSSQHLALYLNAEQTKGLPLGWQRKAVFQLMVVNQLDPAKSNARGETHGPAVAQSGCIKGQFIDAQTDILACLQRPGARVFLECVHGQAW